MNIPRNLTDAIRETANKLVVRGAKGPFVCCFNPKEYTEDLKGATVYGDGFKVDLIPDRWCPPGSNYVINKEDLTWPNLRSGNMMLDKFAAPGRFSFTFPATLTSVYSKAPGDFIFSAGDRKTDAAPKIADDRFPHKCPRCGGAAYVGAVSVECTRC